MPTLMLMAAPVTEFTPLQSLAGGMLIGLAASLLMLFHGRIAGITGILTGILPPNVASDWPWRAAFLAGMVASPLLYVLVFRMPISFNPVGSPLMLLVSGAIVGLGVSYGGGCTSGHGICGLSRLSMRSAVATITFMISTALTVFVVRHVIGG